MSQSIRINTPNPKFKNCNKNNHKTEHVHNQIVDGDVDQLDGEPQHAHDAEADADGLRDLEEFCRGKFGMSEFQSQLPSITQNQHTNPAGPASCTG